MIRRLRAAAALTDLASVSDRRRAAGVGSAYAAIEVEIAVAESGSITGEIEDHGRGEVAMREMTDEGGGFGLRIVDALASRWGVCEGSTRVWFELSSAA